MRVHGRFAGAPATVCAALVLILAMGHVASAVGQGSGHDLPTPTAPKKKTAALPRKPRAPRKGPSSPALGRIVVSTQPPQCNIFVDGELAGTSDDLGSLVVEGLAAGPHEVEVEKGDHYDRRSESVQLRPGEERALTLALTSRFGTLDVRANVPDAQIDVGQWGTFTGGVSGLELSPGEYHVTVSKPGYRTATLDVEIRVGETARLVANIEPMRPKELVLAAEDAFNAGRYPEAIELCQSVLRDSPDKTNAHLVLGASLFRSGDPKGSVDSLVAAIRGGEQIAFPAQLEEWSRLGEGRAASGIIVVRGDAVAFRCDDPTRGLDFFVPLARVTDLTLGTNRFHVKVSVGDGDRVRLPVDHTLDVVSGGVVRPALRDGDIKGTPQRGQSRAKPKDYVYDVQPVGATVHRVGTQGGGGALTMQCQNCPPSIDVLGQVLRKLGR